MTTPGATYFIWPDNIVRADFIPAVKRSKLGFAGASAGARLAAIVQAILIAQLILRVETILIVQTILVLLARLIGGRQRRSGDGHDQCYDDEQKQQLFHRFLPFCDSGGRCYRASARLCPQSLFCIRDAEPA